MRENAGPVYDCAVIGGGVNGCGIARDAAGRGAKVLLLEAGDLASGTSSASTKLIHGGLRYLEHYEFGLVSESLRERERLLGIAPHIIQPMRFVLPYVRGLRPRWLLRLGLFLYDTIGLGRSLPGTETIDLRTHAVGAPLKKSFEHAFVYSDCWVDDARLVVLNARDAADHGADIRTRCEVTGLGRVDGQWRIATTDGEFHADAVINAAGPAVLDVLDSGRLDTDRKLRLVRGSHIVMPKLFEHPFAYFFQLPDRRIFFAIPYQHDFTLIGTTDVDHHGSLDAVEASEEEIRYLCEGASLFFERTIRPADVVRTYSGVRPLIDDGSGRPEAATRGYRLDLSDERAGAPLLSVFGGKITTYRRLAEEAVDLLSGRLPALERPAWTGDTSLPGGDFDPANFVARCEQFHARYPFFHKFTAARLFRAYGTLAGDIFGDAKSLADCGQQFGHGLTEREVRYLRECEWAVTAEDVLWRRTKLGLHFTADQTSRLEDYLSTL